MTFTQFKSTTTLTNAFYHGTNGSSFSYYYLLQHHIILDENDIIFLDNFTTITGSNYIASDFNDKKFMVTSRVNTIQQLLLLCQLLKQEQEQLYLEVLELQHYYPVGPAEQLPGFGWGLGQYGGTVYRRSNNYFSK